MNQWVQRIEEHALFTDMDTLQQAIESVTPLAEEADTTAVEALDRILRVFNHLRSSLKRADPILVQPGWLEDIRRNVNQCTTCLNKYITGKNTADLNIANSYADSILASSAILWQASSPGVEGNVRKAVSDFSIHCSALTRNIEKEVEAIKGTTEITRTHLDEFRQDITNQKQRIDAMITSFAQTFNEAETTRNTEISKWKNKIYAEFIEIKSIMGDDVDQKIKETTQQFEKNIGPY